MLLLRGHLNPGPGPSFHGEMYIFKLRDIFFIELGGQPAPIMISTYITALINQLWGYHKKNI